MKRLLTMLVASAMAGALFAQTTVSSANHDIGSTLRDCVRRGDAAGFVSVVSGPDYSMRVDCAGYADLERQIPMRPDTMFAMFSSSKSVCATAAMILVGEGKLRLDDPVSKYIPEFAAIQVKEKSADGKTSRLVSPKRPVLVSDLLSHRSGSRQFPKLTHREYPLTEAALRMAREPFAAHPGQTFSYNNAGIDTAGRVIEIVAGMPYERFLEERIFKPLGMKDTTFFPNAEQIARLARCYNGDLKPLTDQTEGRDDANEKDRHHCPLQNRLPVAWKVYPAPSAGLYSTPQDFARYSQMLAHHGEWKGKIIVPRKIFDEVYAVGVHEWKPGMVYSYGNWLTGEWFGHSGAEKTDQRVNLRTGHSRCFFTQIAPPGGPGFEHAKEAWNAAVDALQCPEGATPCRDGSTPGLMPKVSQLDVLGGRLTDRSSTVATAFENRYLLMTRGGDVEALEREDTVINVEKHGQTSVYRCTNAKLPGVTIVKTYQRANGGIRRTIGFRYEGTNTVYLTPFTECHFTASFQSNVWHLGAGYIGPYKPFPTVKAPRMVNEYRQSSKGLVFVHPDDDAKGFCHYRVKIDDTVVLPWWHSTIGHYREYHDRLWYLPDGYRMGLGTFALAPGKEVKVTDQFSAFTGDLFTFFDDIFAKDADIAAELKSIPPPPKWVDEMYAYLPGDADDFVRWMAEMTDEGRLMPRPGNVFSWCDYSPDYDLWHATNGGQISPAELREFFGILKSYSPRVEPSIYNIVISTSFFTRVFKAHPEWFRVHDRDGNLDSLFPGQNLNWQTMFNNAECRHWIVDMLVRLAKFLKVNMIYLDETQMTNTIDWERDQVTTDADSVRFWKELKARFAKEGLAFSANGSGIPYADHNYMESPHELAPNRWRDWVGVGMGIAMIHRMRPAQKATPLYWSGKCDCVNRLLALGWVPSAYTRAQYLPVMRAVYQMGSLLPTNVKYAPDWKRDAKVEVESHAMRRIDANDVLVSFINRSATTNDLAVTIDLGSLGFDAQTPINVWRLNLDCDRAGKGARNILADRELKRNWRERGILAQARITDPRLVYSGKASGTFANMIERMAPNKMEQLLITAGPLSFFADDDLPLSMFFTAQRHGRINGRRIKLERRADILMMDGEHGFVDVTANGKPIDTRRVRVADQVGTLVTLDPGEWELDWKEVAVSELAAKPVELPVATAKPLVTKVKMFESKFEPKSCIVTPTSESRGDVKILSSATYRSKTETSYALQTNLPLVVTAADPRSLTLKAGNSRRSFRSRETESWAGFELQGARQFCARMTHNFNDHPGLFLGHVIKYAKGEAAKKSFVGLLIDYRVDDKYVKRVSMAMALYSPKYEIASPEWGTGRKPDEVLELGEWLNDSAPRTFALDLTRFAPPNWDGTAYVSIGVSHVYANRALTLELLDFNRPDSAKEAIPQKPIDTRVMPPPLASKPLKVAPKSLVKLDPIEWKSWTKTTAFLKCREGKVAQLTCAYVAHDYQYLYIGVEAQEPERGPLVSRSEVGKNDHAEVLIERPDGVLYQVLGDAKGRKALYLNGKASDAMEGVVVNGQIEKNVGWRVFFALPVDKLKFDMQRTPVKVKAEIGRIRRGVGAEASAWTPLSGGFDTRREYGTLILDFNW